jgi:hypothetical protein
MGLTRFRSRRNYRSGGLPVADPLILAGSRLLFEQVTDDALKLATVNLHESHDTLSDRQKARLLTAPLTSPVMLPSLWVQVVSAVQSLATPRGWPFSFAEGACLVAVRGFIPPIIPSRTGVRFSRPPLNCSKTARVRKLAKLRMLYKHKACTQGVTSVISETSVIGAILPRKSENVA